MTEDETHFLLNCPLYKEIREEYKYLFQGKENTNYSKCDLLVYILNPTTQQFTKDLCLYLKESFLKRDLHFKNMNSSEKILQGSSV